MLTGIESPVLELKNVDAGASINAAAGTCIQPLLSPLVLDSEADSNRDEALSLACTDGKEELVKLLLSKGTDTEHRDKKGLTPLMLAANAGHDKVVEVLLNHGSNIEALDENTKATALEIACYEGHFKVVELLLKRGANKEHYNLEGCTPLTMAASGGHVDIIKLLLANAAEINSRFYSKRGLSPLMMAASKGHVRPRPVGNGERHQRVKRQWMHCAQRCLFLWPTRSGPAFVGEQSLCSTKKRGGFYSSPVIG